MTEILRPRLEGTQINVETFRNQGLFILRGLFTSTEVEQIKNAWQDYYKGHLRAARAADPNRTINVPIDENVKEHPTTLSQMYQHPALIAAATQLLGPDVAFFKNRATIKDEHYRGSVGAHGDYAFNCGLGQKVSFFVPLTPASSANGSLHFMLKSHHLGFCGGIPKVDPAEFPEFPAVCPDLSVGDVVVCDYHLWHYSLPAEFVGERVLFQIIYQPANDGSGAGKLVSGNWRTDVFFDDQMLRRIWKNSKRNLDISDLTEVELAQTRQSDELAEEIKRLEAENIEFRRQLKLAFQI